MTPKEKAIELVGKFAEEIPFADTNVYKNWMKEMDNKAKQCALIAVDEMLDFRNSLYMNEGSLVHKYLLEVKQEILKL